MGKEIEKKFLLREYGKDYSTPTLRELYPSLEDLELEVLREGESIKQGYLSLNLGVELTTILGINLDFAPKEVRLRERAKRFYFTIKGEGSLSRNEVETEITSDIFNKWWDLTEGKRVEKVRLDKSYHESLLEIDVYRNRNLIIMEIEVPSIEIAKSLIPFGKDITGETRYKNKNLAR